MNLHKYIPTHLTLFLIVGILVGYAFQIPFVYLFTSLLFLIVVLLVVKIWANNTYRPLFLFNIVAYALCFVVGISTVYFQTQKNKKSHYSYQIDNVESSKNNWLLELSESLKPSKKNHKFYAFIKSVNNKKCQGKLLVTIPKNKKAIVGEQFIVNARLQPIASATNPHQFNYQNYLKTQQIYHQLFLSEVNSKSLKVNQKSIYYKLAVWKQKITISLAKKGFKANELAIVKALILGERQFISKDLRQSYANAGVIHILAISGLHIGILWAILSFLCKPFYRFTYGKTISAVIIVLLLWAYAVFSGMSPSVVRAVTMFTALTIGNSLHRPSKTAHNLLISMFVLLLVNPYFLFSVGFQMSYLAVFAIVWLQPKLYNLWNPHYRIVDYFWKITCVSCAAQIGVLPLSLYYFHQFPGLFFVSNLIIIPLLGAVLFLGFLLLFLLAFKIAPFIFIQTYYYLIFYMNEFVFWISSKERFLFQNISFSFTKMVLLYGVLFFFFYWVEKKHFHRFLVVLLCLISLQIIFIFEKKTTETSSDFIIFNAYKNNLLAVKNGSKIAFYTSDSLSHQNTINNYVVGENIKTIQFQKPQKYIRFKNQHILIVDSLAYYEYKNIKFNTVLLQHSPKIHLERLVQQLRPSLIIADGSNYKNSVDKWKETCKQHDVSFYSVYEKGAFKWSEYENTFR